MEDPKNIDPKDLLSYSKLDYFHDYLTTIIRFTKAGMHPTTTKGLEQTIQNLKEIKPELPDDAELRSKYRLALHLLEQKLSSPSSISYCY